MISAKDVLAESFSSPLLMAPPVSHTGSPVDFAVCLVTLPSVGLQTAPHIEHMHLPTAWLIKHMRLVAAPNSPKQLLALPMRKKYEEKR